MLNKPGGQLRARVGVSVSASASPSDVVMRAFMVSSFGRDRLIAVDPDDRSQVLQ